MVRLTVVTTFGLIGVITTGFLGMNLFAEARARPDKVAYFLLVLIPSAALTIYTVLKSRRLAEFLETLADERRSSKDKLAAFVNVWKRRHGQTPKFPQSPTHPA